MHDPRWSDLILAKSQIYPRKGPKKSQTSTILGPASVIWNQISEIWPQNG